ncbi:hypothetical protein SCG7086_CZ_00020 [Chlamydiales bacterium SCGC AG-110-P3]|nr:hypothetical protein SCG7086_CZ_00020 [Chlamydiales bacterium SCGC AG-110-P3]
MLTGSHLRRCIATTAISMAVGVTLWCVMAALRPSAASLSFPEGSTLQATIRLGVTYDEIHQTRGKRLQNTGAWECHLVVAGSPKRAGTATQLHLSCEALDLFLTPPSVDQGPDLRYRVTRETGPDGVIQIRNHYQLNDALSPEKRAALLKALHIDITSHELAADMSLMQQSIDVVVGDEGSIRALVLPADLRSALLHTTACLKAGPLIRDLLNHIEQLPPLLQGQAAQQWTSAGRLLLPITMMRSCSSDDTGSTIVSSSKGATGRLATVFGKTLKENTWTSTAQIDDAQRLIQLDVSGTVTLGDSFLRAADHRQYHVTSSMSIEYIDESS